MDVEYYQYFFCICWDDSVLLLLLLFNIGDYISFWLNVKPCILGTNHIWSWCIVFFIYSWIWFVNTLLRIFINIHEGCWSVHFISYDVLVWFWYQGYVFLIEWIWNYLLPFFQAVSWRVCVELVSFLNCLVDFPVKLPGFWWKVINYRSNFFNRKAI